MKNKIRFSTTRGSHFVMTKICNDVNTVTQFLTRMTQGVTQGRFSVGFVSSGLLSFFEFGGQFGVVRGVVRGRAGVGAGVGTSYMIPSSVSGLAGSQNLLRYRLGLKSGLK